MNCQMMENGQTESEGVGVEMSLIHSGRVVEARHRNRCPQKEGIFLPGSKRLQMIPQML